MQWPLAVRVTSRQDSRHARDPGSSSSSSCHLPCLCHSRKAPHHSLQGTSTVLTNAKHLTAPAVSLGAIPNHVCHAPVASAGRTSTSVPPWRNLSTKYISVGSLTNCKLWPKFYLPLFRTWLCTTKHPNFYTKDIFVAKELLR